jgi:hypothetical protein
MFCPACATPLISSDETCMACGCPAGQTHIPTAVVDEPAAHATRSGRQRPPRYVADLLYLLPLVLLLSATATMGVRAVARHQAETDAYALGTAALTKGQLLEAQRLFDAAGDYEDAPKRAADVERQIAPYAALYSDGALALNRGDYDAALAAFEPVAENVPGYEQVELLLEQARQGRLDRLATDAELAINQGRWDEAERLLTAIVIENPDDPLARERLLTLQRDHAAYVFTINQELYTGHPGDDIPSLVTDDVAAAWPVWSPDRSQIAFITPGDQRNAYVRSLYVVNADGTGLRKVAENPARWRTPLWSPTGDKIAFEIDGPSDGDPTGQITIKIANLVTGEVSDLIDGAFPNASSPSWSPSGDRIAFVVRMLASLDSNGQPDPQVPDGIRRMNISSVYVKKLTTGEIAQAGDGLILDPWRVVWSPRSEELLVFSRPDGTSFRRGKLYRLDLTTDAFTPVDTDSIDVSIPVWSPDGRWFAYVVRNSVIRVVASDGSAMTIVPSMILTGGITWAPSSDRFLALANPGAGPSAMVEVHQSGLSLEEVRITYDADGGDAGPPNWSPLNLTLSAADEPSG